jgi:hypothetical protein
VSNLLLRYLPRWHFQEKHSILIAASPEVIFALAERLDVSDSSIIRFLYWLRGMPARALNKQGMQSTRFIELEKISNQEIIIGLIGQFWKPNGNLQLFKPTEFIDFRRAEFLKAVWNFKIIPSSPTVSLLETETRVECLDRIAYKKFSRYWFFIRPFSGLIRNEMLRAIKKKAERSLREG